jgi:hypothetical protein
MGSPSGPISGRGRLPEIEREYDAERDAKPEGWPKQTMKRALSTCHGVRPRCGQRTNR